MRRQAREVNRVEQNWTRTMSTNTYIIDLFIIVMIIYKAKKWQYDWESSDLGDIRMTIGDDTVIYYFMDYLRTDPIIASCDESSSPSDRLNSFPNID